MRLGVLVALACTLGGCTGNPGTLDLQGVELFQISSHADADFCERSLPQNYRVITIAIPYQNPTEVDYGNDRLIMVLSDPYGLQGIGCTLMGIYPKVEGHTTGTLAMTFLMPPGPSGVSEYGGTWKIDVRDRFLDSKTLISEYFEPADLAH